MFSEEGIYFVLLVSQLDPSLHKHLSYSPLSPDVVCPKDTIHVLLLFCPRPLGLREVTLLLLYLGLAVWSGYDD